MAWGNWKSSSSSDMHHIRYQPLESPDTPGTSESIKNERDGSDVDVSPQAYRHVGARRSWATLQLLIGAFCGAFIAVVGLQAFDKLAISRQPRVKEFAPQMPLTTINFGKRPELWDRPSPEADAVWQSLAPYHNGWVLIPDPEEYNLEPGVPVPELGVGRFGVSMYHQMHCMISIRRWYWQLVYAVEQGNQTELFSLIQRQADSGHMLHCFTYLVQSIECNADLSIEWAKVEDSGERLDVDGMGMPHHQCKDPKAVKQWLDRVHSPLNATLANLLRTLHPDQKSG